jgi:hypothetical protein
LVINANLHTVNLSHRMDRRSKLQMLRMNAEVPMLLTDHFGALMVERNKGGIVFVNVLNSLSAVEIDGVFQATKAFLRVFAESLWLEYRRYGVQVSTVLVNGIEGSESYQNKLSPTSRSVARLIGGSMKPERIVRSALNQVARSKWICVPDYLFPVNHLGVWFLETFRRLGGRLAARWSSKVFDLLLNGDEVRAAREEWTGSDGAVPRDNPGQIGVTGSSHRSPNGALVRFGGRPTVMSGHRRSTTSGFQVRNAFKHRRASRNAG